MKNEKNYHLSEMAFDIGGFALEAMLYEAACFPSPGLVSPVSNGAHRDMNYYTFIASSAALSRYFILFTQEGFTAGSVEDIFKGIRSIGLEAEKEMFEKTLGINTHKGMLFLLGIACAAVGKTLYEQKSFADIPAVIRQMTRGLVEKELAPLKDNSNLSNGERLYLKYKTTGIRGEVEAGMPTVFDCGLAIYNAAADLPMNDRLVHTLLGIMEVCQDSTILHRHSPEVLELVQQEAREAMALGGMRTPLGQGKIQHMAKNFVEKNISPGGSADLLGVTVFFHLVEKYLNSIKNRVNP